MIKSTKLLKSFAALFLVGLLSIESFAAVVSDSDGPAFVTKQEFENLKQDFDAQIERYNKSISTKIDGVIANYLAGLKVEKTINVITAFDLVGGKNKKIYFAGRTGSDWNFSNALFGRDMIYLFANGGYTSGPDFYEQDSYDNWVWEAKKERGSTTNAFFLIDGNQCVKTKNRNAQMYVTRTYAFYSTTHARDGITWSDIGIYLNQPTNLISSSDANIDTTNTYAKGYGHGREITQDVYNYNVNAKVFYNSGMDYRSSGVQCLRTGLETKSRTGLVEQLGVSMIKTEFTDGLHICFNPTLKVRTSINEFDTVAMIAKNNSSREAYTVTNKLQFEGGYWANWASSVTKTRSVYGYGVKFNELLDSSNNPKYTANELYYKELYDVWEGNKTDYKYTGGFPVFKADAEGILVLHLKSDTAITINLTLKQHSTMPSTTSTDLIPFNQKVKTASVYSAQVKNLSMIANTEYDIKVELSKNDILYFNLDIADGKINVTQTASAEWTSV